VSRDTTQFACDSVAHWWEKNGRADYPQATRLLLLCDGGGSNPSNSWLFKSDLQNLADRLELEIRVAHYAPYCSKHNPIEHRVFPHITRACAGVVFSSVSLVRELIEKAFYEQKFVKYVFEELGWRIISPPVKAITFGGRSWVKGKAKP
jgi:hypothetical protein